jgi:FkbM family methyltransferase
MDMLQDLTHRLHISIKILKLVKNWLQMTVYLSKDDTKTPLLELRNGLKFYTNNNILDVIAVMENFESENNHDYFKMANISSKPTIIDIGAHIGAFSIYAATKYPDAKIFCYEPDPHNYEKLIKNIKANNIDNIIPFNQAVGKVNGKTILYSDINGNFGTVGSTLVSKGPRSLEIECITLENILKSNHIDECDFLKMDCEGGEYDILLNSNKQIFKFIKMIVLEYHVIPNHQVDELEKFLEEQDYKVSRIQNKRNSKYGFIYASRCSSQQISNVE